MEDEDEDSTMEEDNDINIAATYIKTFDSLPQDVQCTVILAITPKVRRCAGFRPVVLDGYVDLLTHVPAAYLYASGSYTSTNMERLTGCVQLRQNNFHAVGCLEFAMPGGTKCPPGTKCTAWKLFCRSCTHPEEKTSTVSCEACRRVGDRLEMKRPDMRHHAAGHAFLSDLPVSLCGFCGLDVGCSLVLW